MKPCDCPILKTHKQEQFWQSFLHNYNFRIMIPLFWIFTFSFQTLFQLFRHVWNIKYSAVGEGLSIRLSNSCRVFNNSELKGAPYLAKKRTKRRTNFFSPKSAIFVVKGAQFLTPQTIFIAFLCINFLEMSNFPIFFYFF